MARRWARARPHRLSFLLGGDDPENRLVEDIPAEGFGGRRHAVSFLPFQLPTSVNEVILPVERGRVEVQPIENSSPSFFDTEPCRADHVHHRRVYLSVMPV
jgi:hypothetical protein